MSGIYGEKHDLQEKFLKELRPGFFLDKYNFIEVKDKTKHDCDLFVDVNIPASYPSLIKR